MTECVVICQQCIDPEGRAKRFRLLCVECAEDTLDRHRRDTGHTDLELRVTDEFTADDVAARVRRRRAYWAARRGGWAV